MVVLMCMLGGANVNLEDENAFLKSQHVKMYLFSYVLFHGTILHTSS